MEYIDLFGGIGGFRLGIQKQTNWTCVGYYDNDRFAVQTYNKNFKENHKSTNIREVTEFPDFDLLCAGFPCQAFSIAGSRRGFEDTRGTLFFEIARIAKLKRPKYLFLENVKGLLSHEKGQTYRVIFRTLDELGYDAQWMVLNSKFFGVPQNRERIFIIASLRETSGPEILPFREDAEEIPRVSEKQTIYDRKGFDSRTKGFRENIGETPTLTQKMGTGGHNVPMIANCLDACMHKGVDPKGFYEKGRRNIVGEEQLRRLTPVECERLQGFPDNWTEGVSDTQRYKQLGNAVTVNVIEAIVRKWNGIK